MSVSIPSPFPPPPSLLAFLSLFSHYLPHRCFTHSRFASLRLPIFNPERLHAPVKLYKSTLTVTKLEGAKYTWSSASPKLEGTRPMNPMGWLRLRNMTCPDIALLPPDQSSYNTVIELLDCYSFIMNLKL